MGFFYLILLSVYSGYRKLLLFKTPGNSFLIDMRINKVNNKQKLLSIGIDLLSKKGYNATGVQELVSAAGIPKGSFYNYFESKEDFAVKVLEKYAKEEIIFTEEIMYEKSLTPLQRVEKLLDERIRRIVESNYSRFCLITSLGDEMSHVSSLIAKSIIGAVGKLNIPIINCLTEAQHMGEIKLNLDVKQLGEFIENSWRGTLVIVKASKSSEQLVKYRNFIINNLLN
jgi:TetR/AcrR family transcriptional repressor of nem operon